MSRYLCALVVLALLGISGLAGCGTTAAGLLRGAVIGSAVLQTDASDADLAGACCLPSGNCITVPAADCTQFFGTFFGPGLICGIAPCGDGL